MDLRQLEYFVHVAELGSFTRASEVLGVAQLGVTPKPESVAQFDRYMHTEIAKWVTLVKRTGIQGD